MTIKRPDVTSNPTIEAALQDGLQLTWPSQLTVLKATHKHDWLTIETNTGWGLKPANTNTYKLTSHGIKEALTKGNKLDEDATKRRRTVEATARLFLLVFFIVAPFGSLLVLDADGALKWKTTLTCGFIALIALGSFLDFHNKTIPAFAMNLTGLLGTAAVQIWDMSVDPS